MKKISFSPITPLTSRYACETFLLLIVPFIPFVVYVNTLAPTLTAEDSGELITACYFLGIPHPPGYPTWCILAHPFVYLPWGSVAWRVNLSSAFFSSLSILVLFLFLRKLTKNIFVSISASLLFAFSAEFWEQSVITEVYSLNVLFIITTLYFLYSWIETFNQPYLYGLVLSLGLGLGNHPTMLVVVPIVLFFVFYYLFIKNKNIFSTLKIWLILLLFVVLIWIGINLYLPIRSISNPPMDWGDPETLSNWIAVITRKQYAFMITQYPRSWERFLNQIIIFYKMGLDQFGSKLIFLLSILGIYVSIWKLKTIGILVLSIGLLTSLSAIVIQNFNFDLEWLEIMSVFGIPLYLSYSIFIGLLFSEVVKKYGSNQKNIRLGIHILILLLPMIPLLKNYSKNDYSNYWWAHEFSINILESLEKNSIFIPYSDHVVFPMIYLQEVEGIRKDIKLARKYGYLNPDLFQGINPQGWDKYGPFPLGRNEPELIGWLIDLTSYPIYAEKPVKMTCNTKGVCKKAGIVFRYVRDGESELPSDEYWRKYKWDYVKETNIKDLSSALIWLHLQWARAEELYEKNMPNEAILLIKNAIQYYGEDENILNNAGVLCARYGDYKHAIEFFHLGLKINNNNAVLNNNLNRALRKMSCNL